MESKSVSIPTNESLENSLFYLAETYNGIVSKDYLKRNVIKTENGKTRPLTDAELLDSEIETLNLHIKNIQGCVDWFAVVAKESK